MLLPAILGDQIGFLYGANIGADQQLGRVGYLRYDVLAGEVS